MQRYFNNSIIIDIVIAISSGIILFYSRPWVKDYIKLPSIDTLNGFNESMITVSTTLLGFLLTIVTVIVTFKNSFKDTPRDINNPTLQDVYKVPEVTIFDKKPNKENTFYNTPIHKEVIKVFIKATYEVSIVLFLLLTIQYNVIYCSILVVAIFNFCIFLLLVLTLIRSLYIFHLFLNVHIHRE